MTRSDGDGGRERIDVTVAIPTRNRPDSLCQVVADVWAGRRRPDEILVICQGNHTQEAADRLRRAVPDAVPALRFYVSERTGSSSSWNDAVRLARGAFIAFSDDDMRLPPAWLETMLATWERDWDRGPVLLTGPIEVPPDTVDPEATPGRRPGDRPRVWRTAPTSGDVLYGGHFGAPRAAFDALGSPPFDERFGPGSRFPGAGDEEFALRLLDAGVPIAFEPSIHATHVADASSWVGSLFYHSQGAGALYVSRMQHRRPAAFGALFRTTGGLVAKGVRSAVRLRFRESAGWFASLAGMGMGAVRWLATEPRNATGRGAGDDVSALRLLPLD